MKTINKTLFSNQNVILPKSRSEYVYRSDNTSYETNMNYMNDIIRSGILYNGTHSKSGTIHTISNIPSDIPNICSIRFKATSDYVIGDIFSINGVPYNSISTISFTTGAIIECNVDKINKYVYIINKTPLEPPYNPIDLPTFTYTGQYETINDGELGWRIKFLSSGSFTLLNPSKLNIDVFIVGGGASGQSGVGGRGGGGGYTKTIKNINIDKNVYSIIVGNGGNVPPIKDSNYYMSGGVSSGFSQKVTIVTDYNGGSGGGGIGGSSGKGQGTTTREFGETNGELYSSGGGGGGRYHNATFGYNLGHDGGINGSNGLTDTINPDKSNKVCGGIGGVGAGNGGYGYNGNNAADNNFNGTSATFYGGGGGGAGGGREQDIVTTFYAKGGAGYQGIVIIRNKR